MAENWTTGAHILHTSKGTSNELAKLYWSETSGIVLERDQKAQNFYLLWDPKWPKKELRREYRARLL